MSTQTMNLLFGLLTIAANLFVLIALGLWVFARRTLWVGFRDTFGPGALWTAFAVALVTVCGSLYYSEIAHFEPCKLCWFQRIALYPMVIITLVGAIRRDTNVKWYGIPVLLVGAAVSIYHYQYEWLPKQAATFCSIDPGETPCNVTWFRQFGFMSLAYMALSSALAIITLLLMAKRDDDEVVAMEDLTEEVVETDG